MSKIMYLEYTSNNRSQIIISENYKKYLSLYIDKIKPSKIVYVTDKSLYPVLQKNFVLDDINVFILNTGEGEKNFINFEKLLNFYFHNNIDKKSLIIAFGGGMVSDITGFAASVYYRGVPIVYIPTSLLSQVDAAIGGKNTINFQGNKNIIGTVYLPKLILIDPSLLSTLPLREFSSGMAEVIKYAVGFDKRIFSLLEKMSEDRLELFEIIKMSVEIKIWIVEKDLYETGEKRKLLNLGHTLGQSLESQHDYALTHGEAVSIGLLFSLYISFYRKNIDKEEFNSVLRILQKYNLPPIIKFSIKETMQKIRYDKKNVNEGIDFILLKSFGKSYACKMNFEEIQSFLEKFQSFYYSL